MDEKQNKDIQVQEIDLIDLARKIWAKRRLVIKNCFIAGVVGVIIAFSIPKEYEAKVTLAPEASGGSKGLSGSLGSLASLAGINLGSISSEDAISSELYPEVLKSTPFIVNLFSLEVETKKGDLKTTLYDYLENHQKEPWFNHIISAPFKALGWVLSLFKEKPQKGGATNVDYFRLTMDQADMVKAIEGKITSVITKKTGILTVAVRTQDPLVSATLANKVKENLQNFIIDYRTSKAKKDLEFTELLYEEAKKNYLDAQKKYASYIDNNLDIVLQRYKAEEERLENEMNIMYNVYNQVAQQKQVAKAKVQERTPIYTTIQPAIVPIRASSPRKIIILFGFVFLTFVGTAAYILFKNRDKA